MRGSGLTAFLVSAGQLLSSTAFLLSAECTLGGSGLTNGS
jgi:hypothetical protein